MGSKMNIKEWLDWKGITVKDIVYMGIGLGSLMIVLSVFLYAGVAAILS